MGLQKDTGLTSGQYTWLGSIYYAGYIPAVPIHNRMFQIFPPAKYIAFCMICWGAVLACMGACHNWAGLMVQRTVLGMLEAVINCGFSIVTAQWYRKYEHATRVGIWSSCTGLATILGGIIAYGCVVGAQNRPDSSFSSWKILALVTGLVTVVYGSCMLYFIPGSAVTAGFFTEEEKTLAVERLRENYQGVGSTEYKKYQAKEAFKDIRVSKPHLVQKQFNLIADGWEDRLGCTSCLSCLLRFQPQDWSFSRQF
jgi:ACS family allantoate permease-like MFS transporter